MAARPPGRRRVRQARAQQTRKCFRAGKNESDSMRPGSATNFIRVQQGDLKAMVGAGGESGQ